MNPKSKRRDFLKTCAGGTAGVLAAASAGRARAYRANETIRIGCIGTGGRAGLLMKRLAAMEGVELAAVCDVWDERVARGREIAGQQAFVTAEYREVLDRRDVDAVLIATPDHWHARMTIDACEAGKDVYVEKPLTHELAEGPPLIAAQKKAGNVVQVGTQQRSMPQFHDALKLVREGKLGKIYKAHLTWNRNWVRWQPPISKIEPNQVDWKRWLGPAPEQPFDAYRLRNWRWFWDFGGGIFTDLMVHFIDVVYWLCELDRPESATSIGDKFHFVFKELWETPDTVQTLIRFPDRELQVHFEGTFVNRRNDAMIELMGTDATLYLDRGRWELYPERGSGVEYAEHVYGQGSKGGSYYHDVNGPLLHLTNWIECIRTRRQPNAPLEAGVRSAAAAHLANLSLRSGKVARWDKKAEAADAACLR